MHRRWVADSLFARIEAHRFFLICPYILVVSGLSSWIQFAENFNLTALSKAERIEVLWSQCNFGANHYTLKGRAK